MKLLVLLFSLFTFSTTSFAQLQNAKQTAKLNEYNGKYDSAKKLIPGNFGSSLDYAFLLYKSNQAAKADDVLMKVISAQVVDVASGNYGLWPWGPDLPVGDKNVPLFHAHEMLVDLWDVQDKMSFETRAAFVLSCKRLVAAVERRWEEEIWELGREYVAYSNVFAMYVQTLTVAAERFKDARLKRVAHIQWIRFYNHFQFYGIDEFLSTTYDDVIFNALRDVQQFATEQRIKNEAKEMMDYVYTLQLAVTHPVLQLPVSGIGRDYRKLQKSGDIRTEFLKETPPGYVLPQKAEQMKEGRKYPFEVAGKAGVLPFLFKSYQLKDAGMGSMTGGSYFWQQIHLMATAGKNAEERASIFIPGSYSPNNGFTDQKETTALVVYNRLPTMWHLTQWREDVTKVRETMCDFGVGISNNWKEKSKNAERIVLEAYGYDVHIFPYQLTGGKIVSCTLQLKQRDKTSCRYHQRPASFGEYVFPEEPEWFGAFVVLAKSGKNVDKPNISFREENGINIFSTDQGHEVKVFISEQGRSTQIFPYPIDQLPRITIK